MGDGLHYDTAWEASLMLVDGHAPEAGGVWVFERCHHELLCTVGSPLSYIPLVQRVGRIEMLKRRKKK